MKHLILLSVLLISGCGHVIMLDNVCRSDVPKVPIPEKSVLEAKRLEAKIRNSRANKSRDRDMLPENKGILDTQNR